MKRLAALFTLILTAGASLASAPQGARPAATTNDEMLHAVRKSRQELLLAYLSAIPDQPSPQLAAAMRQAGDLHSATMPAQAPRPPQANSRSTQPQAAKLLRPVGGVIQSLARQLAESGGQAGQASSAPAAFNYGEMAVADPAALADALFEANQLDAAAVFYEKALADKRYEKDRDWLQFQAANCMAKKDPSAAGKLFRQLLTDFPSSPWRDVAQARLGLIDWQLSSGMEELNANQKKVPGAQ